MYFYELLNTWLDERPLKSSQTFFYLGRPTIQSCAPGTEFNAKSNVCDFPSKANCKKQRRVLNKNHKSSNSNVGDIIEGKLGFYVQPRQANTNKAVVYPSPPSGQRVRLRGGKHPYSGYLELWHSGEWGFVCDDDWSRQEADIVCKQLGFNRGVASTTQVSKIYFLPSSISANIFSALL